MKKLSIILLVLVLLLQSGAGAFAEEGKSLFAEHGLEDRVLNMSEVSGKGSYELPTVVNGGNYVFKVKPYWGKITFPEDHAAKCFVPEGAKSLDIPYKDVYDKVIDAVEEKAKGEGEHEWRCHALEMKIGDAPSFAFNMYLAVYYEDGGLWNRSNAMTDLNGKGVAGTHTVEWNGSEQTVYSLSTYKTNASKKTVTLYAMHYVPVGYDGVVFLLDSSGNSYPAPNEYRDGDDFYNYVKDSTLFFRLK